MKNTKPTIRTMPARQRRFKTNRLFRQPKNRPQPETPRRPHPANDFFVLSFYPGMQPDQPTAA